ncbi:hypothetical protein [Methylobacterium sp. 1030]|uniref:hypothetical protein n=1 Tax=Methylobacterium sp. 1030 TaxID=3156404 RepID=UPI0033989A9A
MTTLPPVTLATPAPRSTVTVQVHRSWKARGLIAANAIFSFLLALLGYLGTINLANFGLTADRALFWASVIGLAQFILLQIRPFRGFDAHVRPGEDEGHREC